MSPHDSVQAALPKELTARFSGQYNCVAFYKRFIECPNFASWVERRRQAAWAWQVGGLAAKETVEARRVNNIRVGRAAGAQLVGAALTGRIAIRPERSGPSIRANEAFIGHLVV